MDADEIRKVWQSQPATPIFSIAPELLLREVRRNGQSFDSMIFWRDVREIGVALILIPIWFVMGIKLNLPWAWYLMVPAILWMAGFMLVDRILQNRQAPLPADSLHGNVQTCLSQVEHQIWLLNNVIWWSLLPTGLSACPFFIQVAWEQRELGWLMGLIIALDASIALLILVFVNKVNRNAVNTKLEPRRQELQAILDSLGEQPASASDGSRTPGSDS